MELRPAEGVAPCITQDKHREKGQSEQKTEQNGMIMVWYQLISGQSLSLQTVSM
jgi:hypothetical protein